MQGSLCSSFLPQQGFSTQAVFLQHYQWISFPHLYTRGVSSSPHLKPLHCGALRLLLSLQLCLGLRENDSSKWHRGLAESGEDARPEKREGKFHLSNRYVDMSSSHLGFHICSEAYLLFGFGLAASGRSLTAELLCQVWPKKPQTTKRYTS